MSGPRPLAIITADKIALISGVTAILIVLAYVFRLDMFSRQKQTATNADKGQQSQSDPKAY